MVSHQLSGLPASRPADWGYKVSVCIAVCYRSGRIKKDLIGPSGPRRDDRLILVTDNRAAFGEFSGEHLTTKSAPLWHGWSVMFAGNDVEHAEPIIRNAKQALVALAKKTGRVITPEEASGIVDHAYSEQLQAQIENKILRKHGYDTESFQRLSKEQCTAGVYARVWDQIGKEKFSLKFLVTGHDENGLGHIWLVDGESAPTSYNTISFWAIGRGANAALGRIAVYLSKHKGFESLEEALYVAVTAKFAAESAENVGQSTFVVIDSHWSHETDAVVLQAPVIDLLRVSWNKREIPRAPSVALRGLKRYLPALEKQTADLMKPFNTEKIKQEQARQLKSQKSK